MLVLDLGGLPPGQLRVALALIGGDAAPTYRQIAERLGVRVGTVLQHLNRIRQGHPEVYRRVMRFRQNQLLERHQAALERAKERSHRYFRRIARRRFAAGAVKRSSKPQ